LIPVPSVQSAPEKGERLLIAAMLEEAIRTAEQVTWGNESKLAQWWLFDDPDAAHPMKAQWICEHLGISYEALCSALKHRFKSLERLWSKEARALAHMAQGEKPVRYALGKCRVCHEPARTRASLWCVDHFEKRRERRRASKELYYRRQSWR
jgi:hypothetical protein